MATLSYDSYRTIHGEIEESIRELARLKERMAIKAFMDAESTSDFNPDLSLQPKGDKVARILFK